MKLLSRWVAITALSVFSLLASAQIPSGFVQTTATVPSLANGTYGAAWTNLSSSPQLGLLGCVSTFQTTVNGAIDSKGYFSTLLADTAQICPTPSTWTFTLTFACPGSASSGAFQVAVPVTGGGGTEDITSQITAALPANPCGGSSGGPVFYPSAVQGAIPFVLQAYPTVKLGNSGIIQTGIPGTASQTDTFPGTVAASIVNTVYYSNMYASLSAGVSAACNGTAPGKLVVPVGTTQISSTLTIPSNCHVTGAGKGQTIIQASSTFPGGELIVIPTGASNVTIDNLAADGNRSVNSAGIWCISLDGASGVDLKGVTASNCLNQGVRLIGNNAHVHIEDSEIFNNGFAAASSQSGGGISVQYYTGLGTASDVLISHNKIHDNNTGILVSGSGVVGQDVNGVTISENHIYSNANDAVSIGASNVAGGNINGLVVTGNEINCNGWPPSGAGFSVSCTPGFQQNGASQSQGGVGVDLIQQGLGTINRPIVSLNNIHDNVFEGISPTTSITPIVSTSGTAVSWVSGPHFNVNLKAYQPVIINGTNYSLSSVGSTTSATLTTSAGTQTSVTSDFPGYMGGTFTGNTIVNSGNGNMGYGGVGPCIYNAFSDSNVFTGNVGVGCWLEGFEDFYSSFTIHNGDKAYSNGVGGAALRTIGFNNLFGLSNSYADIGTWDVTSSPSQTVGWKNNGTSAFITSNQIYATTPISDLGTLTTSLINGNVAASTGGTINIYQVNALGEVTAPSGTFNTVLLSADPTTAMQAATKQYVDAQGGTPPISISNIDDTLTGWKPVCIQTACNPGGVNAPASTTQTINNVSPSLDGNSMLISETTNASSTQTNALWVYSAGSCDSCTTITSDFQVYITNGSAADNIEFDSFIFDASDNLDFMFGTQCNQTLGYWQIANNSSPWQTSSTACNLTSGTWHHIIEKFHRVAGDTSCTGGMPCEHFDSISVDGNINVINMTYVATTLPTGWASTSGLQFQIDIGATTGTAITVSENLDEVTFTEGPTAGYVPIGGGAMTGPLTVPLVNGMKLTSTGIGSGSENLGGSIPASSTGINNLAVGPGVLNSNTTGINNVGAGQGALYVNTTGTNNTALGPNALNANTTGNENEGIGQGALSSNTTASDNTGVGKSSLAGIIASSGNTAVGAYAGFNSGTPMTTTSYSTFIGLNANDSVNGLTNTTAIGYNAQATQSNQVVIGNTGVTQTVLQGNVLALTINGAAVKLFGSGNESFGGAIQASATGSNNTVVGSGALYADTTGYNNSAFGLNTLNADTTGYENTGVGQGAMPAVTTGKDNTGVGKGALGALVSGAGNTAVGAYSGSGTTTATSTFIGEGATNSVDGLSNDTVIGYNAQATMSNEIMIGNSAVTQMCFAGGRACWYSSSGVPSAALCVAGNVGSLYSNTDGSSPTTTLYVCTSAGVWEALYSNTASGVSGMTAGQVPIAASASTVTSSKALAGSGTGITTGPTSSTNLDCAQFSGTTGQIADAGAPCGSGGSLTLTTIGSSGAATYSGGTLNIPVYSGGGSGALTQIAKTSVAVATSSITFSTIPATYTSLRLVISGAQSNTSSADVIVQFNGDTGTDYAFQVIYSQSNTPPGGTSLTNSLHLCNLYPVANGLQGGGEILIPGYTSTTFQKVATGSCVSYGGSATQLLQYGGTWTATAAAINQIVLTVAGGYNFSVGTVATLYGMQ